MDTKQKEFEENIKSYPAAKFAFDERIKDGWLSDRYFIRSAETLLFAGLEPVVTLQIFAKTKGVVCGVYEAVRLLETCLTNGFNREDIYVETLMEGDPIVPWLPVMKITGPYRAFAHLETVILGVLARRSLVASNVRLACEAANGKDVLFMPARHDDWRVQTADGYAASVGGARGVSSNAGGAWWGAVGFGTMPHALIAAFGGDAAKATVALGKYLAAHEPGVEVVSLVDYHNDVIRDSLEVAKAMEEAGLLDMLTGVRVDTSERLVDQSLIGGHTWGQESPTGVTPSLVWGLRTALDGAMYTKVGVVVSGGFTPKKIKQFEEQGVPASGYGVGSSLVGHNKGSEDGLINSLDFTADVVKVDGRSEHKIGREERQNPGLRGVRWEKID